MSDSSARMREDRALRDASLALFMADIAHLRASLAGKSIQERIVKRVSEGAVDVFEEAVEVADNHRGLLATLIAAVLIWFARNPILSLFIEDEQEAEDGTAEMAMDEAE